MLKGILVALRPGSSNDRVADQAIHLARHYGLSMAAIAVVDPNEVAPRDAVPPGAGAFKVDRDRVMLDRARQAARASLDAFATRCQQAGVHVDLVSQEGDLGTQIGLYAQAFDLLVVGVQSPSDLVELRHDESAIHEVIGCCPRPVIVAKTALKEFRRVLVAYDGSIQAARALQAFIQAGILHGNHVDVITIVDPNESDTPAAAAVDFLRLHQITADVHRQIRRESTAADIVQFVESLPADLLVMGAYGRSAIAEFLLGSVTQQVLRDVNVSVFVSH